MTWTRLLYGSRTRSEYRKKCKNWYDGELKPLRSSNVRNYGIPDDKVISVPGLFHDTLTVQTAEALNLKQLSVVHIDSDLFESARDALRFCTPFLQDGTIIVFDEWFQFRGNPTLGEQRAFREWSVSHPEWLTTSFQKEGAYRNSFIVSTSHAGTTAAAD